MSTNTKKETDSAVTKDDFLKACRVSGRAAFFSPRDNLSALVELAAERLVTAPNATVFYCTGVDDFSIDMWTRFREALIRELGKYNPRGAAVSIAGGDGLLPSVRNEGRISPASLATARHHPVATVLIDISSSMIDFDLMTIPGPAYVVGNARDPTIVKGSENVARALRPIEIPWAVVHGAVGFDVLVHYAVKRDGPQYVLSLRRTGPNAASLCFMDTGEPGRVKTVVPDSFVLMEGLMFHGAKPVARSSANEFMLDTRKNYMITHAEDSMQEDGKPAAPMSTGMNTPGVRCPPGNMKIVLLIECARDQMIIRDVGADHIVIALVC